MIIWTRIGPDIRLGKLYQFFWNIVYISNDINYFEIRSVFNKVQDFFFLPAFKIVVDPWKSTMLLLYILWDDWPIFMISGSNEQQQQQLEYTLLKPDRHSWWI